MPLNLVLVDSEDGSSVCDLPDSQSIAENGELVHQGHSSCRRFHLERLCMCVAGERHDKIKQ